MAAYNKINQFVEDIGKGLHNLATGALTIALTTLANKPVATNTVLSNLSQISYTNLSARVPTLTSFAQTGGVAKLTVQDLVLTASGPVAPFGALVLYNDTPASKPLICWWEYPGPDVVLADTQTFTMDFDNVGGLLIFS